MERRNLPLLSAEKQTADLPFLKKSKSIKSTFPFRTN